MKIKSLFFREKFGMKLTSKLISLLIIISIILLSGCSKDESLSKEDEKVLSELGAGNYKFKVCKTESYGRKQDIMSKSEPVDIKWEQVGLSYAKYNFDSDIDSKNRKSYIEDTVNILTEINKRCNKDKKYDFYISDKVISHNENNKVYIKYDKEKFDSEDFIIEALYSVFGETSNYGLLYGEASDIQNSLKINNEIKINYDKDFIEKRLKKSPEMLDLNLLEFSEFVHNSLEIGHMKVLAREFVNFIKEKHGNEEYIKLLNSSSENTVDYDDKFVEYMNEFLKHKDLDIKKEKETFVCRYKIFNDPEFPVCICTKWMNYCVGPRSNTLACQTNVGSEFFANHKNIINHWEKSISDIREFLNSDIIAKDCKDVYSYLTSSKPDVDATVIPTGYYLEDCNYIYCRDAVSYIHEYTHYLTLHDKLARDLPIDLCYGNGIAEYCAFKFDDYRNDTIVADYLNDAYQLNYTLNIKSIFDKYLSSIGLTTHNKEVFENIDIKYDFTELMYYKKYLQKDEITSTDNLDFYPYVFGCAYTRYLIDNYGIEKYMEYFNGGIKNNFYDVFGTNQAKMQERFIDYLKNKYATII